MENNKITNMLDSADLDFYLNESIKLSSLEFLKSLITSAVLAYLINLCYQKYSNPLSNRKEFSKNFIILGITTCIVITIVKSSLALSLGLVGALSIVRFRAAIKEPEELIYLFLVIAAGLGAGAGQNKITIFVFLFVLIIIIIQKNIKKRKHDNEIEIDGSSLKISISKKGLFPSDHISYIENTLKKNLDYVRFISINSNDLASVRNYEIKTNNKDNLEKIIENINLKFSDVTIVIVNNQSIIK